MWAILIWECPLWSLYEHNPVLSAGPSFHCKVFSDDCFFSMTPLLSCPEEQLLSSLFINKASIAFYPHSLKLPRAVLGIQLPLTHLTLSLGSGNFLAIIIQDGVNINMTPKVLDFISSKNLALPLALLLSLSPKASPHFLWIWQRVVEFL